MCKKGEKIENNSVSKFLIFHTQYESFIWHFFTYDFHFLCDDGLHSTHHACEVQMGDNLKKIAIIMLNK